MERSTTKETATKMLNTVATDHVGVKANDRASCTFSAILKYPNHRPNLKYNYALKKNLRQTSSMDLVSLEINLENFTNRTHRTMFSQPIT